MRWRRSRRHDDAKLWLAKVLVDEYGEGSEGHDHATLYASFLRAAGSTLPDRHDDRVPDAAHRFIAEHRRIVTEEPFLVGLGALSIGALLVFMVRRWRRSAASAPSRRDVAQAASPDDPYDTRLDDELRALGE